jgi:hypothetical protein
LAVFDQEGVVRAGFAAHHDRDTRIRAVVHVLDMGVIRCI